VYNRHDPLEGADAEEYVSASSPYLGIDTEKVVPEEKSRCGVSSRIYWKDGSELLE
jgi:hypothetical protein